ncbi:hypothetical protein PDESU_00185 [Pontiella desulfatans]|uniref:Polymerase beta nucleotidyltransferase domain-containing protein n=1 Tax=Pontiella desulfatans TaxID=2750659 RepID=A0A6C2TVH2_PONDE|nr:nucleotidyltransferase domain-containing protein [Pontiella desulfatans]VGO11640.1 hypothetical protein PDESU_00185 [Pontiella desulfatans]
MIAREQVLDSLRSFKEEAGVRFGIESLGIFGSVARGLVADDSDVDVVVKLATPNLFTLSRLRIELEDRIGQHVDLVSYRSRMNSFLKERIDQEACYV